MGGILQTPAGLTRVASPPVALAPGLLWHLASVLRDERLSRDVILAEVVATLKQRGVKIRSDSPLSRFETKQTVPNHLDEVVSAYAEVLRLDPLDLWMRAVEHARNGDDL